MNSDVCENDYVYIKCNLYGSDNSEVFAVHDSTEEWIVHHTRVKCKRCGLVYSNPQATRKRLEEFYSNQYDAYFYPENRMPPYAEVASGLETKYRKFFRKLNSRMLPGRFLDIGCATGHLLKVGEEFGWEVYGVELAKDRILFARERLGLKNIYPVELEEANFENDFFDCVYMWHVLEHLPDPTFALTEIHRILNRRGELLIGVPTYASPHMYFSRFLHKLRGEIPDLPTGSDYTYHFTPLTLRKILEKNGFRIKKLQVYYNPGVLDVTATTNWKGRLEKK